MLWGGSNGGLELRRQGDGGVRLSGRFSYGVRAVLSDGGKTGRPRKEEIAANAFSYRINDPKEDIHLLVGHSYDKPLASRGAGTFDIRDTPEAVIFDATITPEMQRVSYVQDALAGLAAGLIIGLSPGFRIPPERAVKNAETVSDEGSDPANGMHNAIIRTIWHALLYEFSLVTRPAYPETQVEARNWNPSPDGRDNLVSHLNRWRL
ncbi:HK97 family phage prohead protease [Hoeflea sp.]|uniref:HK97 family phage prohead protease n=1 Tax=Hoeflea sp. TaxID=1940281 RepID=UPI003A8F88D8